jgi:hypothetical protein
MRKVTNVLTALLIAANSVLVAGGQVTGGGIHGSVRNQLGEAVAGAKVTAVNSGTNQSRTTTTDDEGRYRLPSLAIGIYEITIEADKYEPRVQQVTLRVNEDAAVDVQLQAAGVTEQTTVVGTSAPITETTTSVLGLVIENKQIMELPLNGRNFLQLGSLVANVNSTPSLRSGAEGGARNGPFAVAGQRDRSLTFLVDGVDNTDSLSGSLTARFSVDSIQEFKMITSLGSAEYGYHSGGTINIITRAGSNDFHFGLFEFFRDNSLNAPNYFEKIVGRDASEFSNNQFGGSVAGPIRKDSTFIFANYEGQRLRAGSAQFSNVPTEDERRGLFRNPFTGATVQVPVDPVSAEILRRYVPVPNAQTQYGNFIGSPLLTSRSDFGIVRVDHLLTGDDLLNVRYYISDSNTLNPINLEGVRNFALLRPPTIPGFGVIDRTRTQNLSVAHTHNFSVRTINDLRFGYNRYLLDQLPENEDKPSDLGFTGVEGSTGIYLMSIGGMTSLGGIPYPIYNRVRNYHISDSLSHMAGRHMLKFGGDVRFIRQSQTFFSPGQGIMSFVGISGISPIADFVMGMPVVAFEFQRPISGPMSYQTFGLFVQDDFQATRRLVLNLGVRYELATVLTSPGNKLTNYNFSRGLFTPGVDTDTGLYKADHNNFAPRVGFALSITEDGRTVLRGGYGFYYDSIVHALASQLNGQNPADGALNAISLAQRGPGLFAGVFEPATLFPLTGPSQSYEETLRTPYAQQFNLTLQREFGRSTVASVGYVGTRGTHLLDYRNINQGIYIPGFDANGVPLSTLFNVDDRRPTQLFNLTPTPVGAIDQIGSGASSTYHSLQATVNKRLSRGFSILGAYTWSKSIDDAADPFGFTGDSGAAQNNFDLRQERARSAFDIAHQVTVGATYEIPLIGNEWVRGWQLNSAMTYRTGQPFTILLGFDPSLTGSFFTRPNNAPGVFTSKDGQIHMDRSGPVDPFTGLPAAVVPATGQFGTMGRNTFTGQRYKNVDLSVVKTTRLGERLSLQTRFEMFNVFNTTNLALPERRVNEPTFGLSSRTQDVVGGVPGMGGGGPRTMQIALRLTY